MDYFDFDIETLVLFLIVFVPSLVCAMFGYLVGKVGGKRAAKKDAIREVHQEAVRRGVAVWNADQSGAPTITWLTADARTRADMGSAIEPPPSQDSVSLD